MKLTKIKFIFIRYFILLILVLFNLKIIYTITTPITIFPVFFILKLFYSPVFLLNGGLIVFETSAISLITACIAGSAYYLLILLNLSTPMPLKTRIKSISFVLLAFLALNIIRILVFSMLFASGFEYFSITHRFVWYIVSTLMVIGIWFSSIAIFRIKEIPIYTDIQRLIKLF
ncbi:MAG: pacearchaeosortase [archaeon]|nr:pacearchaeosortase [archaeon]